MNIFKKLKRKSKSHAAEQNGKTDTANRPRFNWKYKLGMILFGLFVFHVFLELALRVAGFVFYPETGYEAHSHPPDAYRILCVGDSCTAGEGATNWDQMGYPAQLQRILNQRHPDRTFSVVKRGFPGANSSQIAKRLDGFLKLDQPDLLILTIGNNDLWNLNETRLTLFAEDAEWEDRLGLQVAMLFNGSKVFNFYKWLILYLDEELEEAEDFNAMDDVWPSTDYFNEGKEFIGEVSTIQKLYEYNFRDMLETAEEYNTRVLFIDYHRPARMRETEFIQPAVNEVGGDVLDLGPYFDKAIEIGLNVISGDRWHANDLGYTIFARAIYNGLVEREIVNGEPIEPVVDENIQPIR